MPGYVRWIAAGVVADAVSLPVGAFVQSDDEGRRGPARDWTFFGGDWTNQRHSTLTQITPQNVKTLRGAWTLKFDGNASTRATPMVKDGVLFVSAGSRLYALDAKSGERKWVWRPAEESRRSPGEGGLPHRELTLMPRFGSACPQLGMAAGGGGSVSAGRFLLRVPLFLAQLIASRHSQ
jgi:hypothetical protein